MTGNVLLSGQPVNTLLIVVDSRWEEYFFPKQLLSKTNLQLAKMAY